ncbi:SPOSA6832_00532 [Sporobolomyces salmonicolor]|uniref:SPOSA6832_00532-mRNA-1:cds n=1 Tax=Sporidiobolus salmonicolor TaxID=5005 RepID=A0A0D6EGW3_SPOSA|nr:SPOSA6832_00532 [Sporobolomyces salmonicolor]
MESPVNDIRNVVRELCEPAKASDMSVQPLFLPLHFRGQADLLRGNRLNAVDRYFASDAQIVYPLLNSPKRAGIEGIKSVYKMLRGESLSCHGTIRPPRSNQPKGVGMRDLRAEIAHIAPSSRRSAYVRQQDQQLDFHVVAFDRINVKKGIEYQSGLASFSLSSGARVILLISFRRRSLLDMTEHLKFKFLPIPDRFNPTFHIRFITRIDLRKDPQTELWKVVKQEDNLPSDFGSTGLHFLPFDRQIANAIKVRNLALAFFYPFPSLTPHALLQWGTGVGTLFVGGALSRLNLF